MKSKLFFPVILITGLLLVSFSANQVYGQTNKNKTVKQEKVKYTCPQHPEVNQDKPGTCPKCGMTLVDKKDKSKGNKNESCDSTKMNSGHKQMKQDSTKMKKTQMINDTASMKPNQMGK
jgi:Cu(I)/Ag(I) efflux system membrane fusion protein